MPPGAAATELDCDKQPFIVIWKTTTESEGRIGEIARLRGDLGAATALLLISSLLEGR
jgi:hypothetical protein